MCAKHDRWPFAADMVVSEDVSQHWGGTMKDKTQEHGS